MAFTKTNNCVFSRHSWNCTVAIPDTCS